MDNKIKVLELYIEGLAMENIAYEHSYYFFIICNLLKDIMKLRQDKEQLLPVDAEAYLKKTYNLHGILQLFENEFEKIVERPRNDTQLAVCLTLMNEFASCCSAASKKLSCIK